jgi:hypothetical protein
MRRLQDNNNVELKCVLERLLFENVDITAREVARRHSELKNASAFTRNGTRMTLIAAARQRQAEARNIAANLAPSLDPKNVGESAKRTTETKDLERQVRHLVAAHAGLIRAVQLAGGMGALERFWLEYKEVGDTVRELDAAPRNAVVLDFPQAEPK